MQTHVSLQMMIASESLVTLRALERFLARVCSFMILQDVFVAERTIANLAREDFVFRWIARACRNCAAEFNRAV
jgi:hypothetical protein